MSTLPWMMAILLSLPAQARADDPCRNGSFEELGADGFPSDWGPLGKVEVSSETSSGKRSIRLVRTSEPPTVETGINGRPIDRLKGGIDFHYMAVYAKDCVLHVYAIPISSKGIEDTGSMRAGFAVPRDHVGDGNWHRARLKYDFTANPAVRSVIFAARLEGTAGELLLDDFTYVEKVGPLLRFGTVRLEEDPARPGLRCRLCAPIENAGDESVREVRLAITAPAGLAGATPEMSFGDLPPDSRKPTAWTVEGDRARPGTLRIIAVTSGDKVEASFDLAPKVEIKSFGPVAPVAAAGRPAVLECVLANAGAAALLQPAAEFSLGAEKAQARADPIPPGSTVTLRATFQPRTEALALPASVRVSAEGMKEPLAAESSLVVGAATEIPPPLGSLRASVSAAWACLENEHVRLAFRRNAFGFGPGEISVKAAAGWTTVAWMPRLSRIVYLDSKGIRRDETVCVSNAPSSEESPGRPARLRFEWQSSGPVQPVLRLSTTFELDAGSRTIATRHELATDAPCRILALEGPMVYALDRDEAIYPGLEWLVGDEVSSGTLDIAVGHVDRIRHVVHPNFVTIPAMGVHSPHGTVGLLWDIRQIWDGRRDRPSASFASPDRFGNQRAHLMGLFLPTVPEFVGLNHREADPEKAYPLEPGKSIRLEARIYAEGEAADALAAVDAWEHIYGYPRPAPPPRGSYEREIEFSMRAYLESLWVPEKKEWWTSKGGGSMSGTARPPGFVADLLLGALLAPDAEVRRRCRARTEEVLALIGGEPRLDAQRFPGRLDLALADPSAAAGLLASRDAAGAWRFDPDQVGTGPFVGADYHELGPHGAAEVGTCAAKATQVLRYARITGDRGAYREMVKTLEFMESFRVPRAAQVWEVPVHSPDILAAAEAVEAFLEAYRFSGDPRWLRDAVTWARRGLPFVYLWDDPERPFLLGASIPVFGATWMQGSWFGRPVQWNGLRYAEAILKLAEYDGSRPWRQIAALLTHSAMHQQDTEGANVALWPDNIGAVDSVKCPWVFTPRMILANVLRLLGRDEDVATAIAGQGDRRLHINANAKIADAAWDGGTCSFRVIYPSGEQGIVVVFGVGRPTAVSLDGKPIAERRDIEKGTEAGWRYEPGAACLSIRVPRDGESRIHIEGAAYREGPHLPRLAEKIDFEFDGSLDGWTAAHDVSDLQIQDGSLVGRITGPDPYIVRGMLRVRADTSSVVVLRMRVTAGQGGQLYWATESSPSIAEDKVIVFPIQADGQFHEYRLEPGKHPLWAGLIITALRIDPGNGAPSADFAIDFIRTEAPSRR